MERTELLLLMAWYAVPRSIEVQWCRSFFTHRVEYGTNIARASVRKSLIVACGRFAFRVMIAVLLVEKFRQNNFNWSVTPGLSLDLCKRKAKNT